LAPQTACKYAGRHGVGGLQIRMDNRKVGGLDRGGVDVKVKSMRRLHKFTVELGHSVIKLKPVPGARNVAVVAQDGPQVALSITGGTGEPLVPKAGRERIQKSGWTDLKGGPHIPHGGRGFWKGISGFSTEAAACEELLEVLGPDWAYCNGVNVCECK
jgi:hypothetical protein